MKKNLKALTAILLALTVVLSMAAFAFAQEEEDPAVPEDTAELDRLGTETEEGCRIALLNSSGSDITAVCIKAAEDEDWSDSLLAEEDVFEADETSLLCWEPEEDVFYDLQLTYADETQAVLHGLDLTDIDEGEILCDDTGLTYLAYTSVSTGEQADTLEAEQALAAAAAEAEVEAESGGSGETYSYSAGGGGNDGCLTDALFW